MSTWIVLALLASHFAGDFLLQNDYMAQNKSKSSVVLNEHVFWYMVPFVWVAFMAPRTEVALMMFVLWYAANYLLHFATDYVSCRLTSYYYPRDRHKFFVVIGADQLLHYAALLLTYDWLIRG